MIYILYLQDNFCLFEICNISFCKLTNLMTFFSVLYGFYEFSLFSSCILDVFIYFILINFNLSYFDVLINFAIFFNYLC